MSEPNQTNAGEKKAEDQLEWERKLIARLAFAALNEQRRARRWNIFFRTVLLLFLVAVLLVALPEGRKALELRKHTAIVDIEGIISSESEASAKNIIAGLQAAFQDKNTEGVIIRINSPGGSPVQAGYVNDEILRLRDEYPDTPVYAVVTDICASGGYYIAVAADKIVADKASMVGSIGVLMNSFGFVEALDKLGVERRLLTAGENKGFMDPFSPTKDKDIEHIHTLLDTIHLQFINVVKNGRGERLARNEDLFSGYIWTGEQSLELGLVDELGDSRYVARELIGEERLVNFTQRRTYFDRFAERLGTAMGKAIATQLGAGEMQLR